MDRARFDALTRALATGIPRRRVLRGLLGGVAAVATVEGTSADSPQRKCKQASRPCAFDTHCCSGTCCNKRCCGPDELCDGNGECVCAPDNAAACAGRECGPAVNNCGATVSCGICTGTGEVCDAAGQCVCTPDNTACAGRECGSAVNNCGQTVGCGTCPQGETCDEASGQCEGPGFAACSADICGSVSTCANGCGCVQSVDGGAFCVALSGNCVSPCDSDDDCNGGICATAECCGTPKCIPAANLNACVD